MRPRPRDLALAAVIAGAWALRLARAATAPALSEDPFHRWWIASSWALTGHYADPLRHQVGAAWLPGFDALSALAALAAGHASFAVTTFLTATVGAATVAMTWMAAEGLRKGAGPLAALALALDPFHVLLSAQALPDAWAVALVAGAAAALWRAQPRPVLAAALLACACLLRYEAWLAAAALAGVQVQRHGWRASTPLAVSAVVALAWLPLAHHLSGTWPSVAVAGQLGAELASETAAGFVPSSPLGRLAWFLGVYAWPMLPSLLLAIPAARNRAARPALLLYAALALPLLLAIALGFTRGSARYLLVAAPALAILASFGAGEWGRLLRLGRVAWLPAGAAVAALVLACLTTFHLADAQAVTLAPRERAGQFLAAQQMPAGRLVVSESALAVYAGHVDASRAVGSKDLPADPAAAMAFLAGNASYIVHVVDAPGKYPEFRLGALWPALNRGQDVGALRLAYNATGWESAYGAQEVYVYRVVQ